jgi:hypothetical protein
MQSPMIRTNTTSEPCALWSSRLSLFALALLVVDWGLHRTGTLSTPVALTVAGVAFGAAALGVLAGLYAAVSIWIRGRNGASRVAVGLITAGLLWLGPVAAIPTLTALPSVNDISTDTANPPKYVALVKDRGAGSNSTTYPGERVARQQLLAYPDLRTFVVDRSADEVFDLAVRAAAGRKGLGWKIKTEEPPSLRPLKPGLIEATERTTLVGFTDDIVIRVAGTESEARVDIRSSSRFGRHDLGANANRVRRFIRELQSRLEATQPGMVAARGARAAQAAAGSAKQPLKRSPETKAGKSGQGPAPQDARRAPAQKVPPRG